MEGGRLSSAAEHAFVLGLRQHRLLKPPRPPDSNLFMCAATLASTCGSARCSPNAALFGKSPRPCPVVFARSSGTTPITPIKQAALPIKASSN